MRRTMLAAVLLLLVLLSLAACGPTSRSDAPVAAGDRLQEANRLLGEEKAEEAKALLEPLVSEEPENAQAWFLLGRARLLSREYEDALAAARRAVELGAGAASQVVLMAQAGLGDLDGAAETFPTVLARPVQDLSGLRLFSEAEALRTDPRFAVLFPEDFDDPFSEGPAVIHDWHGEGPGWEFGWEARNAGDVDGDGVSDAVVSAPAHRPAGGGDGAIDLYSGRSGALLWRVAGVAGARLGEGVEAAGDVNGDGTPDVVAGAPGVRQVLVYSGDDGRLLLTLEGEENVGDSFGTKVAGVGDLDGDGRADLLVGSPSSAAGDGRAYVYSGADGTRLATLDDGVTGSAFGAAASGASGDWGSLLVVGAPSAGNGGRVYVYRDLSGVPAFTIEAEESAQRLGGMFSSVVGDVDADGIPDVYASDWLDGGTGPAAGRIYVHSGRDGSRLFTVAGEAAGDGFGIGPARAGDVDGDGHDDLVVGAWQHKSAAPSGGKIYVLSGRDGSVLQTYTGRIPGETLGFDADGLGDVNGDGRIDFLVTSAWSLINGVRSGRTLVISGGVPTHSGG